MKITLTRTTIGKAIGIAIVGFVALLLAYLATAWVWWEANPGYWSFSARLVALLIVVGLLAARWIARNVDIAAPAREE